MTGSNQFNKLLYLWYPPLLATILYGIYIVSTNFSSPENFSWVFLIKSIVQFYSYLFFITYADKVLEKIKIADDRIRLIMGLLLGWVISLMFGLLLYVLVKQSFIIIYDQNDQIGIYHLFINMLSITVGYILIFSMYFVTKTHKRQLKSELKNVEYAAEKLQLKYEVLYNKLEPHFLFNNLNTLHSLIVAKDSSAEEFVMSLSKVMRHSFQSQEVEAVFVKEEVKVFQHYEAILKKRLGNALSVNISINQENNSLMIPMTLPHLLENVMKHNEISNEKPLNISLKATSDGLEFSNTLNLKKGHEEHQGSLHTLNEMYRIKTGQEIHYSVENGLFKVKVPYLKA